MLRKITIMLAATTVLATTLAAAAALAIALSVALVTTAGAHPLSHIAGNRVPGHPAPPRIGWGPQAGNGPQCKPGWTQVDGRRVRVWC